MADEWLPVVGWEHRYEVSSGGRVRKVSGHEIGQWISDQGYPRVRLSQPRRIVPVHRLVATAFLPNPDGHPVVNHLDHNRRNNLVENLEWCSQAGNLRHAADAGRMQKDYWRGKRSPSARLDDDTVRLIRRLYREGNKSWESLGKQFGISKRSIGRIIHREHYTNV